MAAFDPYHNWLSIPPGEQPPHHYRLLGLPLFEDSIDVIENAADRQMLLLRTFQIGPYSDLSQKLLNEIAAAKVCLLGTDRKAAYDLMLRQKIAADAGTSAATVPRFGRGSWPWLIGAASGGLTLLVILSIHIFGKRSVPEAGPRLATSNPPTTVMPAGERPTRKAVEKPAEKRAPAAAPALVNSLGMPFTRIPAGRFEMGLTQKEADQRLSGLQATKKYAWYIANVKNQVPRHPVRITRPFYLGLHHVTQAEYQRVMGVNPSQFSAQGKLKDRVAGLDTSRFPVDSVSWDEANEFCRRLTEMPAEQAAHRRYRLPTEAEWEYACRAGTTTRFSFGDNPADFDDYGWYVMNSSAHPHPVGKKKPNAWGLYDMQGNLWQWTSDGWSMQYYRRSPFEDPPGPGETAARVVRGGCYASPAKDQDATFRHAPLGSDRYGTYGFRAACDLVRP